MIRLLVLMSVAFANSISSSVTDAGRVVHALYKCLTVVRA